MTKPALRLTALAVVLLFTFSVAACLPHPNPTRDLKKIDKTLRKAPKPHRR